MRYTAVIQRIVFVLEILLWGVDDQVCPTLSSCLRIGITEPHKRHVDMQLSYPYQRCALHRQSASDGDCDNDPDLRYLCQKLEIPSVGGTVEPSPSSPLRSKY